MVWKQSFGSCESLRDEIQPEELLRTDRIVGNGASQPVARHPDVGLFHSQRAAAARLRYAVAQEASLVILCGPGGSGVSTVLSTLSKNLHQVTHVVRLDLSTLTTLPQSASHTKSRAIVFIIDNCHLASDGMVGHVAEAIWQQSPSAAVVLGGRGRLLTLLARDRGLLDKVLLRSVLHPFSFPETLAVVQSQLNGSGLIYSGRVPEVIHELTAGIAKDIFQLIGTVRLVGGGHGDRPIEVADIEQIHERLHAAAA